MISSHCFSPLKVCRLRAVRLDANGAFLTGADNAVVWAGLTRLSSTPELIDGEQIRQRNGCGDIMIAYDDDDRYTGLGRLTMTLSQLDWELIQALAGGTLLTDGGGNTVGYEPPTSESALPNGAAVEVWGWAWDVSEPKVNDAGERVYHRRGYPLTKWTVREVPQENGPTLYQMQGKWRANSNFGTGPAGDWPAAITEGGAEFLDETDMPEATCGYQTVAIAS